MAWTKEGARLALVGYLLVVAAVLGGLSWATIATLRLEETEWAAESNSEDSDDLLLGMTHLDGRVEQALIREGNRSPYEYKPILYPECFDPHGHPIPIGMVMKISPLVEGQFEPWIMGHFSVSAESDWSSPQIPASQYLQQLPKLAAMTVIRSSSSRRAAAMLKMLRSALTPDRLGEMVAAARERDESNGESFLSVISFPDDGGKFKSAGRTFAGSTGRGTYIDPSEFMRRKVQTDRVIQRRRLPAVCDPRDRAQILLDQLPPGERGDEPIESYDEANSVADNVSVETSGLTGIWLPVQGRDEPILLFVRVVPLQRIPVYQGFVLDWPKLKGLLLGEIQDLFPESDLVPVGLDPIESPETLMTLLPARLVAQPELPQAQTWSSVHTGLSVSWIAALVILMGAGFGVRGLLALAERRSEFAYAVSHELRTPLTTFRLYTDMLADGLVPDEKRQEYLETLNSESQRLTQLVGGVLEYSQLEHHSVQPAQVDTTVRELLESVRERYESQCSHAQRKLVIDANGIADAHWNTDPDIALQILGTLIDNACKYAREAEDRRIILSASNGPDNKLALEVRDFGPGVPKKEYRSVFKPFRRGSRVATTQSGIGLGLALSARWAKLLQGQLELVPVPANETGACFRLTLPAPEKFG